MAHPPPRPAVGAGETRGPQERPRRLLVGKLPPQVGREREEKRREERGREREREREHKKRSQREDGRKKKEEKARKR